MGLGQVQVSAEEVPVGKCTLIIDANVHDGSKYAVPTGDPGCEGLGVGIYNNIGFSYQNTPVKDGDVVRRSNLRGKYYHYDVHIKTIDKKAEPKPKPKPKEEPKKETKPKQESKPKQSSKPKQQSQSTSKTQTSSKSTTQSQTKKQTKPKQESKSVVAKQEDNQIKKEKKKEKDKEKNDKEKTKKNKKKAEKLTVNELRENKAEVVEKDGKFYAIYKDKDNKEVKQKITESEAEKLGYEKEEKTDKVVVEKESIPIDSDKGKQSKTGTIVVSTLGTLGLASGGAYYLYRRKI